MSQNSASASPSSPSGATPGNGFFTWLRGLGIVRGDAWFGGVCGGLADRLGIDPIIVRGIAVVLALLGGPAFLLYAIAWALLPDANGAIHLERLIRGTFDAATVGIIVFALLAFLPVAQGVWWAAGWGGDWGGIIGRIFWSAVVIAAIVLLIVWASRRHNGSTGWGSSPWTGAAAQKDGATPAAGSASFVAGASASNVAAGPSASFQDPQFAPMSGPAPEAPASPASDASSDAMADWRARQAEWKTRYQEWKTQQAEETRVRREQRAAASQADALERARLRRLSRPHTGGAFVAIALGAALIVGAIAAATSWSLPSVHHYQTAFGFAAATAVVGLAMLVAGFMRRTSGFLAFVAIVLTVVTVLLLLAAPSGVIEVDLPGSITSFHL